MLLTDKNTRAVFGDYISVYDIQRAVQDGATVPIYYESRLAKLELDEQEKPRLDEDVEEVTEGEDVERKEHLKRLRRSIRSRNCWFSATWRRGWSWPISFAMISVFLMMGAVVDAMAGHVAAILPGHDHFCRQFRFVDPQRDVEAVESQEVGEGGAEVDRDYEIRTNASSRN